jgi:hypothetical protein
MIPEPRGCTALTNLYPEFRGKRHRKSGTKGAREAPAVVGRNLTGV